jgi:hypothetical protein
MEVLPPAETASICGVHLQQTGRRASYRSPPYNDYPVPFKVVIPLVLAGIKQPHQRPAILVDPTQVGTFVQIAVVTCERKIFTHCSKAGCGGNSAHHGVTISSTRSDTGILATPPDVQYGAPVGCTSLLS